MFGVRASPSRYQKLGFLGRKLSMTMASSIDFFAASSALTLAAAAVRNLAWVNHCHDCSPVGGKTVQLAENLRMGT
jgi:hypothetical protein